MCSAYVFCLAFLDFFKGLFIFLTSIIFIRLILRSFSHSLAVLGYSGLTLVCDSWDKSESIFVGWMLYFLVSVSSLVFWSVVEERFSA